MRERKKDRQRETEKEREREREICVPVIERELSDGPPPSGLVEVCTAEPTPIFVCGAARTHAVHLQAGATSGDLRAAVKRMGYSAAENGLCVVGGAPLPLDDRLTLAQCGIQANSSVQVAGRLLGGVEVTIGGRKHTIDARGRLDLRYQDLDPAEAKEVAAFLATSAGGAIARLTLSGNMITGSRQEWDDDVEDEVWIYDNDLSGLASLCDAFLTLKTPIELDLSNCGLSVNGVNPVAKAISAGAALTSVVMDENELTGTKIRNKGRLREEIEHLDADLSGFTEFCSSLKSSTIVSLSLRKCYLGPQALDLLADAIKFKGALTEVNVAFNQIGSDGGIALRDGLKTSNLKFLAIGKMYTSVDGTVITGSQLTTGVTLYVGGRSGEFLKFHEDDRSYAKLKWADDGKESDWMKLNSLDGEPLKLPLQSPFEGDHLDLAHQQLDPGHIVILAWWLTTEFSAAVARLSLSGNMVTSSSLTRRGSEYDKDPSGLILLCDALPALKNPIDLDLSNCGLSVNGVNPVIHAIQAGGVRAIGLAGCQLEPPVVAQVLSVASEVSRSRLRVAQVLAFCCALHDRMGADSAICDMVDKGVVDIWQIVASIVHARHGHEGLCSALACRNPWYEVCVRGLVPEGVPHS